MQGIRATCGEIAIHRDQVLHPAHLGADDDHIGAEPQLFGALGAIQSRHHDGFAHHVDGSQGCCPFGIFIHHTREQILIQAAPVHADAHRLAIAHGGLDHFGELRIALAAAPDVAWVDAQLAERLGAGGVGLQQLVSIEMEIADERRVDAHGIQTLANMRHGGGRLVVVHRDAHQFRPRASQRFDLHDGALDIGGIGVRHRLHDDRRVAADGDGTHFDGQGMPSRCHRPIIPRPSVPYVSSAVNAAREGNVIGSLAALEAMGWEAKRATTSSAFGDVEPLAMDAAGLEDA